MTMKKILGIGNALVDVLIRLDNDTLLSDFGLKKGSMTLVDKQKAKNILEAAASFDKQKSSGGSAANSIHGLAQLGAPAGYIGKIGDDEYGSFFRSYMTQNNIHSSLFKGGEETGKCISLISKDSERTFATYLGAAIELDRSDLNMDLFKNYDYVHLEGYLVQNHALVQEAVTLSRKAGNEISIDLASFNIVEENVGFLRTIVEDYIDIVFANEEEARAFTGKEDPAEALTEISKMCRIAVVKIGKQGSLIAEGNRRYQIDPITVTPVDTTGAGDLYASGFYYGLAKEYPLDICGQLASAAAGKVVEVIGAKMDDHKWNEVMHLVDKIEDKKTST
jgi:sugar/nucleoside kinase (ribokinase family)